MCRWRGHLGYKKQKSSILFRFCLGPIRQCQAMHAGPCWNPLVFARMMIEEFPLSLLGITQKVQLGVTAIKTDHLLNHLYACILHFTALLTSVSLSHCVKHTHTILVPVQVTLLILLLQSPVGRQRTSGLPRRR